MKPNPTEESADGEVSIKLLWILLLVPILSCVVFGLVVYCSIDSWEKRGLFGDMFGALNALFSGLAFAGVIYAILLQRKELALQREELRLSREELAAQNELISAQLRTMQESLKHEQSKESLSSEPFFKWGGGKGYYASGIKCFIQEYEFDNEGGPITGLSVLSNDIESSITPTDHIKTGGKGKVEFRKHDATTLPNAEFRIQYTTQLGKPGEKTFALRAPGGKPVEAKSS